MTCNCKAFSIDEQQPWVAFRTEVHTADRCGAFLQLDAHTDQMNPLHRQVRLTVTWPDGTRTGALEPR